MCRKFDVIGPHRLPSPLPWPSRDRAASSRRSRCSVPRPPTRKRGRHLPSSHGTRGARLLVAQQEEEVGAGGPPMSSGADGSAPGAALDPGPGPEPDREPQPPLPQAPAATLVPAPQQEMVALQTEAPAVTIVMSRPGEEVQAPAPQQEVVALQTEAPAPAVTIVISRPGEEVQVPDAKGVSPASSPQADGVKAMAASVSVTAAAAAKEAELARSDSFDDYEQCRVCQQKTEEPLVDLGCRCRGDLAKAHRTCIDVWFRTRGSNKCEICQQVAVNIPPPETQASTSYWVWRVDSTYGRGRGGRERGWFSPLWVAFAILIGGLLLDVLISVSLGVSALPVNIIIGVLIVLGLGTALRLALECCQEWGSRRNVSNMPRLENIPPTGYHPAVV
uniref:RING-CH-type domain-containing protein n=3 Tax=Setaria TaxID=4554 RepID=K4AB32_SETIT